MNRKISKVSLALILVTVLAIASMSAVALLIITRQQAHSVHIRGVNLNVTPASVSWNDLDEGAANTQNRIVTVTASGNEPMAVSFSDNLATAGLTMSYPVAFILSPGQSVDKTISLVYSGSTTFGDYGWTVTVTGTNNVQTANMNLNVVEDAFVHQAAGTTNYGTTATVDVGIMSDGIQHGLMKFNGASITGKTVTLAKLRVYYSGYQPVDAVGRVVKVHQITSAWTEGTVTYTTAPTFNSAIVGSAAVPAAYGWVEIDVTSLVQSWASGTTNNGVMLKFASEVAPFMQIHLSSREGANPATLIVTYLSPT